MKPSPRDLLQVIARNFGLLNKSCCNVGHHDISLVQSQILYEIDRQHQPSVQQIADTLGMDITTFSRQIQSLVKKNFVKKIQLPEDRRVYILLLTTEGKFIAGAIDKMIQDYLEKVFLCMSESEQDIVLQALQLLNESIIKAKSLYSADEC
ncbi:MarR family winged helix-turn-helix transcriptional regulator [Paenibacillus assamensis]|uniref:MarR family winged helix-turn-helix transcriptional regulator n=1 Tax=Paenibacillus assamensis TaxID=311244 RepID=UPI00040EC4F1|nr:MarR family winged helix-turn-helix transcriptional regulator [Paenibacillus assamensis]